MGVPSLIRAGPIRAMWQRSAWRSSKGSALRHGDRHRGGVAVATCAAQTSLRPCIDTKSRTSGACPARIGDAEEHADRARWRCDAGGLPGTSRCTQTEFGDLDQSNRPTGQGFVRGVSHMPWTFLCAVATGLAPFRGMSQELFGSARRRDDAWHCDLFHLLVLSDGSTKSGSEHLVHHYFWVGVNLPNRRCQHSVTSSLHSMVGGHMTYYIAEVDETQQVVAVWVREKAARAAHVFDPQKHKFDVDRATGFSGASKEDIGKWVVGLAKNAEGSASR